MGRLKERFARDVFLDSLSLPEVQKRQKLTAAVVLFGAWGVGIHAVAVLGPEKAIVSPTAVLVAGGFIHFVHLAIRRSGLEAEKLEKEILAAKDRFIEMIEELPVDEFRSQLGALHGLQEAADRISTSPSKRGEAMDRLLQAYTEAYEERAEKEGL